MDVLSARSTKLHEAFVAVDETAIHLKAVGSALAVALSDALAARIGSRVSAKLRSIVNGLTDASGSKIPAKPLAEVYSRLFVTATDAPEAPDNDGEDVTVQEVTSFKEKMLARMQSSDAVFKSKAETILVTNETSLRSQIARELESFGATSARLPRLSQLFDAIASIQPTSVEAERAFSAAGCFSTKSRSRLSDKSLSALCFLRCNPKRKGEK